MNANDIYGFDATTEEILQVYAERDRLRDENRMYRDILDELMKYFKMTASHWKYSDIPHFVKISHEFALEKNEAAKDALREFGEDICKVLGVNYEMSTDATILSEVKRLRESVNKQEDFTEEAASILGVHPGDLTLSDILEALRKLKREEKLDDMNSSIIADLKEERDKVQQNYLNELGRRKTAERYISDSLSKICSALGIEYSTDTTIEYVLDTIDDLRSKRDTYSHSFGFCRICEYLGISQESSTLSDIRDEIADLRNRASCQQSLWDQIFWESMCRVMEMDPADATPSDVLGKMKETKKRLISLLALNPDTATWTDIYDGIKAEQKDHCDLISESYKMKNELEDLRDALDKENEDFNEALRKTDEEALRQMRESYISVIKQISGGDSPENENLAWYEHRIIELYADLKKELEGYRQSYMFQTVCSRLGLGWRNSTLSDVTAAIDDLKTLEDNVKNGNLVMVKQLEHDKKFLEGELEHTDERRRHWVRRYKEEHEKAVNLDALYRKYKALYDADAPAREKLSDDLETYRSSYEAIKNEATKNRSLMNTVAQIVGTVGMHDDVTMAGVLNAKKKANHWDILVDAYGEGTMRSLLENIGIDVSGDKGNGLFK